MSTSSDHGVSLQHLLNQSHPTHWCSETQGDGLAFQEVEMLSHPHGLEQGCTDGSSLREMVRERKAGW